jgi:hypothetical protein
MPAVYLQILGIKSILQSNFFSCDFAYRNFDPACFHFLLKTAFR